MKCPTKEELDEFKSLFNEFREWKEAKNTEHISDDVIHKIIKGLNKTDAIVVEAERLLRHNRYLNLCTSYAPFFFSNMEAAHVTSATK